MHCVCVRACVQFIGWVDWPNLGLGQENCTERQEENQVRIPRTHKGERAAGCVWGVYVAVAVDVRPLYPLVFVARRQNSRPGRRRCCCCRPPVSMQRQNLLLPFSFFQLMPDSNRNLRATIAGNCFQSSAWGLRRNHRASPRVRRSSSRRRHCLAGRVTRRSFPRRCFP